MLKELRSTMAQHGGIAKLIDSGLLTTLYSLIDRKQGHLPTWTLEILSLLCMGDRKIAATIFRAREAWTPAVLTVLHGGLAMERYRASSFVQNLLFAACDDADEAWLAGLLRGLAAAGGHAAEATLRAELGPNCADPRGPTQAELVRPGRPAA